MESNERPLQRTSRLMTVACRTRTIALLTALQFLLLTPCCNCPAETTNELRELRDRCEDLIVRQARLKEAKPILEQLLIVTLKERGELHQDTVVALHWVGYLALQSGRYPDAEQAWQRSLAIQERLPRKDMIWFTRT